MPAPDLQDVFVAGILFQLAGLHQLVDLRNQELKGYTVHRFCKKHLKSLDDRVARKQVGGREQIEGKKSEVTEDE